jgi:L,D-transpeptidase catalytic domain
MTIRRKQYYLFSITFFLFFLQFPVSISGYNKGGKQQFIIKEAVTSIKQEVIPVMPDSLAFVQLTDSLYRQIKLKSAGLAKSVFAIALKGYQTLTLQHGILKPGIISIADFSKPSSKRRFYIIDLNKKLLLLNTMVAHGRNSGMVYANAFSNKPESNKSSLGFYTTLNSYWGEKGYALRLQGEEPGVNDKAYDRNIVIHGSEYVNEKFLRTTGHVGRSLGCPAVPMKHHKKVIDYIKGGTCLFIYHPTKKYLKQSKLISS